MMMISCYEVWTSGRHRESRVGCKCKALRIYYLRVESRELGEFLFLWWMMDDFALPYMIDHPNITRYTRPELHAIDSLSHRDLETFVWHGDWTNRCRITKWSTAKPTSPPDLVPLHLPIPRIWLPLPNNHVRSQMPLGSVCHRPHSAWPECQYSSAERRKHTWVLSKERTTKMNCLYVVGMGCTYVMYHKYQES